MATATPTLSKVKLGGGWYEFLTFNQGLEHFKKLLTPELRARLDTRSKLAVSLRFQILSSLCQMNLG